ncbi:DUF6088 family protein [Myroides sp. WP-1]|uniref:DUF6088 family protein n=1 Tax=Myroides sp. WP-1 TaxID=2759944 RepID=UPI0015F9EBA7|nr:DUF6088 family protein [Myroides sp. WP-1]MBB1138380.1 hypothetical protein [Myroides sp. WP-1]
MVKSVQNQIENKIVQSYKGHVFFADDFTAYGTADNIRQVLFRLEKKQCIERIAQGIYVKPKEDHLLGKLYPSIEEIAQKIAKRDQIKIAPTGVMAQYLLGLTTQIPLKAVYLTDGSPRKIAIGSRTIYFKRTVPKTFLIKDKLLFLLVQALRAKEKKEITPSFLNLLLPAVKQVGQNARETQLKHAPRWIQEIINQLYSSTVYVE